MDVDHPLQSTFTKQFTSQISTRDLTHLLMLGFRGFSRFILLQSHEKLFLAEDENSKIQEQQKPWFLLIDQKDEESSSKIAIYQTRCASFDLARSPLSLPLKRKSCMWLLLGIERREEQGNFSLPLFPKFVSSGKHQ